MEIDTTNIFMVGVTGDRLAMLKPPHGSFTRDEALNLAAYLVALAEEEPGEFQKVLDAVQNT